MSVRRRVGIPLTAAALAAASLGHAQSAPPGPGDPSSPPAPVLSSREARYAIALEPGRLADGTAASSRIRAEFAAGDVLRYYGQELDGFGRPWQVVGDPAAWTRRDEWFAFPAGDEDPAELTGRLSLLAGWQAPAPLAARLAVGADPRSAITESRLPIRVAADWWRQTVDVEGAYLPEVGELVAMPAFRLSAAVAPDALALIGGLDALGPWPPDPGIGQLHVAPLLPLVFRYSGTRWEAGSDPLFAAPVVGLLGNQQLALDLLGPTDDTGPALTCWRLAGSRDPRGSVVGRLATAPTPPLRVASSVRSGSNRLLGLVDRSAALWPVSPAALSAPRKVEPPVRATGVALSDESRRQAVFLEQTLPPRLARELRGRELRLSVWARAMPEGDAAVSTTVSIEIEAGNVRRATSASVGPLSTRLDLIATIPEDAESITVRLIPVDRSVSVTEGGRSIFDRAALAPSRWPALTQPAALYLYRVRSTSYAPARRYTRARLVASERGPTELAQAWLVLQAGNWDATLTEAMLAGKLEPDMSQEEVAIAWGEPRDRDSGGSLQRWDWGDRSASFTQERRLIAWQRNAEPSPPRLPICPTSDPGR